MLVSWFNKSKLKPIRDKLCECNELKRLPISLQQLLHIYHKYIYNWPTAVAGPCFHLLDENNQSKGLVVLTSNMHAEFCNFWSCSHRQKDKNIICSIAKFLKLSQICEITRNYSKLHAKQFHFFVICLNLHKLRKLCVFPRHFIFYMWHIVRLNGLLAPIGMDVVGKGSWQEREVGKF